MVKFLFLIIFMMLMINWNYMISFFYNLLFFFGFMLLFCVFMDMDINYMISVYMSMNFYSVILILLSTWIMGLMFMSLDKSLDLNMKIMIFMFMLLILFMYFSMKNMLLFYFFFEFSIMPTYMLIIYWGYNPERLMAAMYMLMYTLFISFPLLIYMMMTIKIVGSYDFDLIKFRGMSLSLCSFYVFMGAFLVKMPMYSFHIWLPKAHVEAPVYGSMILAAILLKMGSYGLLRLLSIFYESGVEYIYKMFSISVIGSGIISFVCMVQIDMKSLVAYSSVVHMNLMLCSLLSFFKLGFISAYIVMISHGICSSGLFYMVNLYYYRTSSRLLFLNKGMINLLPSFTIWWFMLCSSNFSFPLSFGFLGELMFMGVLISWDFMMIIYLMIISFFSSAYSLYLYLYIQHGESMNFDKFNSGSLKDILILIIHFFPLSLMLVNMIMFI